MLADNPIEANHVGRLADDVQAPATFRNELIDFITVELPQWRDRPDRTNEESETILTDQLCAHLNSRARHSGWDAIQFRTEYPDEENRGRKIDLIASPCGPAIVVEGRRFLDFDALLPIECKRLPTPKQKDRDEREYVRSSTSTTGGIQRFKDGHHGQTHAFGAMIGYLQTETCAVWKATVDGWINELDGVQPGWTLDDLLTLNHIDEQNRISSLRSVHVRANGVAPIELRHLWIEMN